MAQNFESHDLWIVSEKAGAQPLELEHDAKKGPTLEIEPRKECRVILVRFDTRDLDANQNLARAVDVGNQLGAQIVTFAKGGQSRCERSDVHSHFSHVPDADDLRGLFAVLKDAGVCC